MWLFLKLFVHRHCYLYLSFISRILFEGKQCFIYLQLNPNTVKTGTFEGKKSLLTFLM